MSKFHVKVGRISGEGLPPQCSNPYLKFNFDNYKLFQACSCRVMCGVTCVCHVCVGGWVCVCLCLCVCEWVGGL